MNRSPHAAFASKSSVALAAQAAALIAQDRQGTGQQASFAQPAIAASPQQGAVLH